MVRSVAAAPPAHREDRLGVTVEQFPIAITDTHEQNRLYRTSFWRAAGLAFEDGSGERTPAVDAYFAARAEGGAGLGGPLAEHGPLAVDVDPVGGQAQAGHRHRADGEHGDGLRDPPLRQRMGVAARVVFARERGAVRRTMVLIERIYARRKSRESGIGNRESGVGNRASRTGNA